MARSSNIMSSRIMFSRSCPLSPDFRLQIPGKNIRRCDKFAPNTHTFCVSLLRDLCVKRGDLSHGQVDQHSSDISLHQFLPTSSKPSSPRVSASLPQAELPRQDEIEYLSIRAISRVPSGYW